jgi:hypothetical protein
MLEVNLAEIKVVSYLRDPCIDHIGSNRRVRVRNVYSVSPLSSENL